MKWFKWNKINVSINWGSIVVTAFILFVSYWKIDQILIENKYEEIIMFELPMIEYMYTQHISTTFNVLYTFTYLIKKTKTNKHGKTIFFSHDFFLLHYF